MTMQRRHFEVIAEVIREMLFQSNIQPETVKAVALKFSAALANTNPNFDRARFLRACGVEN